MAIRDYIQPINRGAQAGQLILGNIVSFGSAINVTGICLAMVYQWLMEIAEPGNIVTPDVLGRYLLHGYWSRREYATMMTSQNIYKRNETREAMATRHTGGRFTRAAIAWQNSSAHLLNDVRAVLLPQGGAMGGLRPTDYYGALSIQGTMTGIAGRIRGLFHAQHFGHAIGFYYSAANRRVYIFDPNHGTFVCNAGSIAGIRMFLDEIWRSYNLQQAAISEMQLN